MPNSDPTHSERDAGGLVQWRTVNARWLGPTMGRCSLIAIVDGNSGVAQARLAPTDSLEENLRVLRLYVERWGLPPAIHTNRKTLFRGNPRSSSAAGADRGDSRIQRVLAELGIDWIGHEGSITSGPMELFFRDAESMTRESMKLKPGSFEVANRHLQQKFLPRWIREQVRPAKADLHRTGPRDLAGVFCQVNVRLVQGDGTLHFDGSRYLPKLGQNTLLAPGTQVQIEEHLDGTRKAFVDGTPLRLVEGAAIPVRPEVAHPKRKQDRRHQHHPKNREWMANFFNRAQPPLWLLLKPRPQDHE